MQSFFSSGRSRCTAPSAAADSDAARPDAAPPPDGERIARETEAARRDFHRAANAPPAASEAPARSRRNAALQAFFLANAGRGLLPGAETSGSVTPQLKDEES